MSSRDISHPANEIRVMARRDLSFYIKYALRLLRQDERVLVIKGIGSATARTLHIAEILKRRIGGLHQVNSIFSTEVEDRRENAEPNSMRQISVLQVTLSLDPLDKNCSGYQDPVPKEQPSVRPYRRKSSFCLNLRHSNIISWSCIGESYCYFWPFSEFSLWFCLKIWFIMTA